MSIKSPIWSSRGSGMYLGVLGQLLCSQRKKVVWCGYNDKVQLHCPCLMYLKSTQSNGYSIGHKKKLQQIIENVW